MIQWPAQDVLTSEAAKNLERLKRTSACQELEDDTHAWRFTSWAWTADAPWKGVVESSSRRLATVTMESGGAYVVRFTEPDAAGYTA
jgi:hypothetical protein